MHDRNVINSLIDRWENVSAKELRAAFLTNTQTSTALDIRTREQKGYSGPRARKTCNVFPPFYTLSYSDKDTINRIVTWANVQAKDHKTVVIVYPTSEKHLRKEAKNFESASIFDEINHTEAQRLLPAYQNLEKALLLSGLEVNFLPMVKLTEQSILENCKTCKPIRFWTSTLPPKHAAYIVVDNCLEAGTTLRTMLSHLHKYGIGDDQVSACFNESFVGMHGSIALSAGHKQFIKKLREHYPDIAARTDAVLELIGIERIEALTNKELNILHGSYSTDFNCEVKNFDRQIRALLRETCSPYSDYEPISEPNERYVNRVRSLLGESRSSHHQI